MLPITLTSAANAGVLLSAGGVRLLVDGVRRCTYPPFSPTPQEILIAQMRGPEDSPWRNVDHLFFTHLHPDHFDPAATAEYLRANCVRTLFAPEWPHAPVEGMQVCALQDGETAQFPLADDFALTVIGTRHAGEMYAQVRNNACIVTAGGRKVLFTGDGDYVPEWYTASGSVDAVFLNPLFLNSRAALPLVEALAPQAVFVHHLPAGREDRDSSFFWRLTERAAKRFPQGLIRCFPTGSCITI